MRREKRNHSVGSSDVVNSATREARVDLPSDGVRDGAEGDGGADEAMDVDLKLPHEMIHSGP